MFKIVHDLSALSEADRQQYCRDFASYLGLNPDENRIDTIWLNSDGVRALVAYCRRGTTDILRDIHNIDVTEMVKEDGPGYVSFKASGINRRGRKEIAVGAFATTGLTGDRLAAAVATAETRAGRRLTLKFVGGGLLDESEVSNTVVTDVSPVASPAVQPQTKPNAEVGKPVPEHLSGVTVAGAVTDRQEQTGNLPLVEAANAILAKDAPVEPVKPKRKYTRKSKNMVDLGDEAGAEPTHNQPVIDIPKSPDSSTKLTYVPTCPVCNQFMAADERLDLYLCIKDAQMHATVKPSMVKAALSPDTLIAQATVRQKPYEPVSCGTETTVAPSPVSSPVPPPKAISPLSEVEQKQVKARLAPFWVDILPKGGMTADDGISIWGKLIKFANMFFADMPDYKKWAFSNWETFFEFLDEFNAAHGASHLVEYINGKINAA